MSTRTGIAFFLSLVLAPVWGGCAPLRFHRDTNAPGHSDVENPPNYRRAGGQDRPRRGAHPVPSAPDDPGEEFLTFNPGIYGGGGGRFGEPKNSRGTGILGIEFSLNRGHNDRSHFRDDFWVYPREGKGVSLGWNILQFGPDDIDMGPIYAEVQRFGIYGGGALGYAVNPATLDHGFQASAWFTGYYVRARYLFDGGFELYGGFQIKIPMVWIWSR